MVLVILACVTPHPSAPSPHACSMRPRFDSYSLCIFLKKLKQHPLLPSSRDARGGRAPWIEATLASPPAGGSRAPPTPLHLPRRLTSCPPPPPPGGPGGRPSKVTQRHHHQVLRPIGLPFQLIVLGSDLIAGCRGVGLQGTREPAAI